MIGVIGAHGFIGRSLVDHYLSMHKPITAFVRHRRISDRIDFGPLPRIKEVVMGVRFDPKAFAGIDTLVLAASETNPRDINSRANEVRMNILPHIRFAEKLRETDVKKLVFLSSGGTVYGNSTDNAPFAEHHPTQPMTNYGYGKLAIEHALRRVWRDNGRWLTILRPSNPVGIHQMKSINQHGLIPTVFNNLTSERTITVFGDGHTVRDFFAVEELCSLIEQIADESPNCHRLLNIGSGQGHSIKDVIRIGAKIIGKPARVHHKIGKNPAIHSNILNTQKAFHAFGWQAKKSVAEIFEDFKQRENSKARMQVLLSTA